MPILVCMDCEAGPGRRVKGCEQRKGADKYCTPLTEVGVAVLDTRWVYYGGSLTPETLRRGINTLMSHMESYHIRILEHGAAIRVVPNYSNKGKLKEPLWQATGFEVGESQWMPEKRLAGVLSDHLRKLKRGKDLEDRELIYVGQDPSATVAQVSMKPRLVTLSVLSVASPRSKSSQELALRAGITRELVQLRMALAMARGML
jgi:hypothetical protein